jgi:3-keto-L-gulonate-6-phosphate decarboxylase
MATAIADIRTIRLLVLGRFEIEDEDNPPARTTGRLVPALLSLLAEQASYPQQELVETLWGTSESVLDGELKHVKRTSNKFHRTKRKASAILGDAGHLRSRAYEVTLKLGPDDSGRVDLRTDVASFYELAKSDDADDLRHAICLVGGKLGDELPNPFTRSPAFLAANERLEASIMLVLEKLYPSARNHKRKAAAVLRYGGATVLSEWDSGDARRVATEGDAEVRALVGRLRGIQSVRDINDRQEIEELLRFAESVNRPGARDAADRVRGVMTGRTLGPKPPRFDTRKLQAALDVRTIEHAREIAVEVAPWVDLLEVGDPLIRRYGMGAVEAVRAVAAKTPVVAEMMCSDWAGEQVEDAAAAGAHIVMLMGCRAVDALQAAARSARKLSVPLFIDVPPDMMEVRWVHAAERARVTGLAVIAGYDSDPTTVTSLERLHELSAWTDLPLAVAGGFTLDDVARLADAPWTIVIIGRAIFTAANPGNAARRFASSIEAEVAS